MLILRGVDLPAAEAVVSEQADLGLDSGGEVSDVAEATGVGRGTGGWSQRFCSCLAYGADGHGEIRAHH